MPSETIIYLSTCGQHVATPQHAPDSESPVFTNGCQIKKKMRYFRKVLVENKPVKQSCLFM